MSKSLFESHFEAFGFRVADEIRRKVYSILTGNEISLTEAALREMGEAGKRGAKAGRGLAETCRAIQSNHQGKRKQGMRNSYGTKWGGK